MKINFLLLSMKVSMRGMPPDEFRKLAKRMSQYVDLRGCKTEKCIKERIRRKHSVNLDGLNKAEFAFRLIIEAKQNPHPDYKEILGMDDEEYERRVKEATDK